MDTAETDPVDETYSLLDRLSFHCMSLTERLDALAASGNDPNNNAEDAARLLNEHIALVDRLNPPLDEFDAHLDWFNVLEPLTLHRMLSGKIVVLDFFTYCCANCHHVFGELQRLETAFPAPASAVVVVGVHSAKFSNERRSSNVLAAVQRHGIEHPVMNDAQCTLWNALGIRCWPTLLVLGPNGRPLFVLMGEGNYDLLERYVRAALRFYAGQLSAHQLPISRSVDRVVSGLLQFPGKIAANGDRPAAAGGAWSADQLYAVCDTGHHRVLVVNGLGTVLHCIGGPDAGFADGAYAQARFNRPNGVCFRDERQRPNDGGRFVLYVADTENHALREVCLRSGSVRTCAGNGLPAVDRVGGRLGREQGLSSPWDVLYYRGGDCVEPAGPTGDVLLMSNAGTHQLWALFESDSVWWRRTFAADRLWALVGSGKELNRNNAYPMSAAFAQPSGLAVDRARGIVYVADSESSTVRAVAMAGGAVTAVAGGQRDPNDLFAFGDVDEVGVKAKLQHPLGIAYHAGDNVLYVSDTYNHCLKRIDVATKRCARYRVYARPGRDEELHLHEPAGLCLSNDGRWLLVADTNNHRIVRVDVQTGVGEQWLIAMPSPDDEVDAGAARLHRALCLNAFNPSLSVRVRLAFEEAGAKLNADAPQRAKASFGVPVAADAIEMHLDAGTFGADDPSVLLQLSLIRLPGDLANVDVQLDFQLNMCAESLCYARRVRAIVPLQLARTIDGDQPTVDSCVDLSLLLGSKNAILVDK